MGKNPIEIKLQKDMKNISTIGYRGFFCQQARRNDGGGMTGLLNANIRIDL